MQWLIKWGNERVYLSIKLPTKANPDVDPHFSRYLKETDPEVYKQVEWKFNGITFKKKTIKMWIKEKEVDEMSLSLLDDDWEEIVITSLWTWVSRSIANSLCSQSEIGKINIWLWMSKSWYATAYIRHKWEPMSWRLSIEEQNELIKVTELPNGEKHRFYGDLEAKLKEACLLLVPMSIERELGIDVDQPTNEAKTLPEDFSEMPF